jgi:hypothetical protein
MKLDNIELINDMYTKISEIKFENNIKKKDLESSSLDFLSYDEEIPKKIIKKSTKSIKETKNNSYKIYFSLFILFYFLNSYWTINYLNSNKISYNLSQIIRGLLFIFCYHFILANFK